MARCGASLDLGSADIDVHPHGASRLERRVPVRPLAAARRGWQPCRGCRNTGRHRAAQCQLRGVDRRIRFLARSRASPDATWREAPRPNHAGRVLGAIAAGLGLRRNGDRQSGAGAAFRWHVISAVDAMCRDFAAPGDRYRFAAIVSLAMFALVYLPVLWMVQQIATPMSIAMPTRYFKTGDVVLGSARYIPGCRRFGAL